MPILQAATFTIDLRPAKTNGLGPLGLPPDSEVKKGKLAEAMQTLDGSDRIGRRYQNLRATLVRATEGGLPTVKFVLAFEVFGDDNVPLGTPSALSVRLLAGEGAAVELPLGMPFMPFAACWYENHFAVDVPPAAFVAIDRVEVVAAEDEVRMI